MELKGLNRAWMKPNGQLIIDHDQFNSNSAWHEDLAECILLSIWGLEYKGHVFQCLSNGGWEFADDEEKASGIKKRSEFDQAYEELENRGWVRLHGFGEMDGKWIKPYKKDFTNKQKRTIHDWCMANNKKYELVID